MDTCGQRFSCLAKSKVMSIYASKNRGVGQERVSLGKEITFRKILKPRETDKRSQLKSHMCDISQVFALFTMPPTIFLQNIINFQRVSGAGRIWGLTCAGVASWWRRRWWWRWWRRKHAQIVRILSLAALTVLLLLLLLLKFAIFINFANLSETYVTAERFTFDIPLIAVTLNGPKRWLEMGKGRGGVGLPFVGGCDWRQFALPNECKFLFKHYSKWHWAVNMFVCVLLNPTLNTPGRMPPVTQVLPRWHIQRCVKGVCACVCVMSAVDSS